MHAGLTGVRVAPSMPGAAPRLRSPNPRRCTMSRQQTERTAGNSSDSTPSLNTTMAPADLPRWLSVDQVRKMQRCRRETVLEAMQRGELPFEQRGRIRYARLSDVIAWEERRLRPDVEPVRGLIHPELEEFV